MLKIQPRFEREMQLGGPQRWVNASHTDLNLHTMSRALLKVKVKVQTLFTIGPGRRNTNQREYTTIGRHWQTRRERCKCEV